jgi:hypothetical protein
MMTTCYKLRGQHVKSTNSMGLLRSQEAVNQAWARLPSIEPDAINQRVSFDGRCFWLDYEVPCKCKHH